MTELMRFNFAARLVVVALSSITMLWLLWRFPTPTCIGSIVLLGFLLHCAHFARVVDVAVGPDRDLPVHGVRGQCPGKGGIRPAFATSMLAGEFFTGTDDLRLSQANGTLPTAARQRLATALVVDESPCLGISSPHSLLAKPTSGARLGVGVGANIDHENAKL
jgi:hypothetical protein